MLESFGDQYRDYRRRVPRLLPALLRRRASASSRIDERPNKRLELPARGPSSGTSKPHGRHNRQTLDSGRAQGISSVLVGTAMRNEFTAVIERDGDWYIAYCPEVPGANGQGRTKAEAKRSLADAIALILEDRRADGLRGVPPDAERDTVVVK